MVNLDNILVNIHWEGDIADYYRLSSEYRILKYKIEDTFKYLDEIIEEYENIEAELKSRTNVDFEYNKKEEPK